MGLPVTNVRPPASRQDRIDQAIIEFCVEALCRRWTRTEIIREVQKRWMLNANNFTISPYLARARSRMRKVMRKDIEDMVAESVGLYQAVIRSKNSTIREKMLANERLDKMLGLEQRGDFIAPEPRLPSKAG
jgi:hypothetical protein